MIMLTRLNGPAFALNPDLIERVDATPDTIVTLVGGTKYVVAEPIAELIRRVRDFRADIIASAHAFETMPARERSLRVVPRVLDGADDDGAPDGGPNDTPDVGPNGRADAGLEKTLRHTHGG